MLNKIISIFPILLVLLTTSCWNKDGAVHHVEHQTINAQLSQRSVDSIRYGVTTEDYVKDIEKIKAEIGEEEVYIPNRTNHINSFPCSSCHTEALARLGVLKDENVKRAHWNIKIKHAEAGVMNCVTCHDEGNLNQLKSITGREISLNHSYKLCAQCHTTQYKEWKGGAHGKRLGGWAPPRVMNTCVNCHDPHDPAFESRWPARLNTVKLKEQSTD